jgi:hypothetical protein
VGVGEEVEGGEVEEDDDSTRESMREHNVLDTHHHMGWGLDFVQQHLKK